MYKYAQRIFHHNGGWSNEKKDNTPVKIHRFGHFDALHARVLRDGRAVFSESFLFDQQPDIRLKFFGAIIQMVGGDRYQPRLNSLIGALSKLQDDCKFTLGHCTIRRLRGLIMVAKEGQKTSFRKKHGKKYFKQIKQK